VADVIADWKRTPGTVGIRIFLTSPVTIVKPVGKSDIRERSPGRKFTVSAR
jgi:hypothetical protein